jgi:predicted AAA+ superfamily ATPase
MPTYRPRIVDSLLSRRLAHHAAILLIGPRAIGKSTTASQLASSILRLDQPSEAAIVEADPDAALQGHPEPILLDEWQAVPDVLAAVKRSVDADPRPGRFVITGSVRGEIDASTWPGTGRLLRVPMYGLTVREITGHAEAEPLLDALADGRMEVLLDSPSEPTDIRQYADWILRSGFPEPALRLPPDERSAWMTSYLEQLIAHDATHRVGRRDRERLARFAEVCALHSAGVLDRGKLHEAAGVAKATGEAYEQLLRALVLIDTLPAWWTNRLKRLSRAPKRMFVDAGLALAALRIDLDGLMRDGDLLGRMLDTFVVAQLRAEVPACRSNPRLHHLRTEGGRQEIDVVVEYGGGRVFGIEVKATSSPKADDARHLRWLEQRLGDRFIGGAVLHTGPRAFELADKIVASPIANLWAAP